MNRPSRWIATAVITAGAAACTGGSTPAKPPAASSGQGRSVAAGPTVACRVPPSHPVTTESSVLPKGLTLPSHAEVLQLTTNASITSLIVQAPGTIADIYAVYKGQLDSAGYAIVKTDNEGREAELYYSLPGVTFAAIQMVRASCPDRAVRILFSTSSDAAAGATAVTRGPLP